MDGRKPLEEAVYDYLNEKVDDGCYKKFWPQGSYTEEAKKYLAPSNPKHHETVVFGSIYGGSTSDPISPQGKVFLIRHHRWCNHDGNPHLNMDQYIFYKDKTGDCWIEDNKHPTLHYRSAVAGTSLAGIEKVYGIPATPQGLISDYSKGKDLMKWPKRCPSDTK